MLKPCSRVGIHCLLLISLGLLSCAERIDLLVVNANIYTVDEEAPRATGLAIRDGRFVAIGDGDELSSRFSGGRLIDAGGATVLPGLIDSHGHLFNYGMMQMNVDLSGTGSMAEVIEKLKEHERSLSEGEWLQGRGWDQNDWDDKRYPTRADIDSVFGDRPVWLERVDGHASLLNSAALVYMGIDADGRTPDPEGGRIVRDDTGSPTGLLIDTASEQVKTAAPRPSPERMQRALLVAMSDAVSLGLTSVHEPGIRPDTLRVLRSLVDQGQVRLRMYVMTEDIGRPFDELCRDGPIIAERGVLTVRAVKLYSDGALGSRGAALLDDYTDDAGNRGLMRTDRASLRSAIEKAVSCGLQPAVHAIGDASNRLVLDIYEDLASQYDLAAIRPRIEHAQVVSPVDIPRFAATGVIAAMQPTHATSDMYWAEDRIGPARIEGAYAWQTLLNTGVRIPFGSDFPVESMDPLKGFFAAVARTDVEGYPEGGWRSDEGVSREQALRGFTIEGAYAAFMEDETGSISAGKLADFIVLDRDVMTVPDREILEASVTATFLGGEQVYGEPL